MILLCALVTLLNSASYCRHTSDSTANAMDSVAVSDSLEHFEDAGGDEEEAAEQIVQQGTESDESVKSDVAQIDSPLPGHFRPVGNVELRTRMFRKLQPASGYNLGRYIGSSLMFYQRARFSLGDHLHAGLLLQKDPGEAQFNDFTSGFAAVNDLGILKTVVVGDYIVEAGHGVLLWRPYGLQKGADAIGPARRKAGGVAPYNSSAESQFLRGVAATFVFQPAQISLFYSSSYWSATLDTNENVTSICWSGYFRTDSEREKKNAFRERIIGGRLETSVASIANVGITGYVADFSRELRLSNGQFSGSRLSAVSADYDLSLSDVGLYGEWALAGNTAGGISGIHIKPSKVFRVVSVYREYPPNFFSLHGLAFGERATTSNERGWYVGIETQPLRRMRLSAYMDQFWFPRASLVSSFPGRGYEYLLELQASPLARTKLTGRYRRKGMTDDRSVIDKLGRTLKISDWKTKDNYRFTIETEPTRSVVLRTRFEFVQLEYASDSRRERGALVYGDLRLRTLTPLQVQFRVAMFSTDSYFSGIAEYESDLPGVLSVPVLYGRGVKWYILLGYSIGSRIELHMKYSELIRDDVKTIGSGLDELPTNRDNRIGLQLEASF